MQGKFKMTSNKRYVIKQVISIILALMIIIAFPFLKMVLGQHKSSKSHISKSQSIKLGPNLNYGRSYHSSILLDNGNVLIVGGYENGGLYSKHPELYDIQKNAFLALPNTHKPHGKCFLQKRNDNKIVIVDKNNIEIFDQSTLSFKNYDKKLFKDRTMFNVVHLDGNYAILYTNNNVYKMNLYNFKLQEIFKSKNQISLIIPISTNSLFLLQNDYQNNKLLMSKYDINKNKIYYKKEFKFNSVNAADIDSNNIILVDYQNNIYVYSIVKDEIIRKAAFSVYNFYGKPRLLKLQNKKVLILFELIPEYQFISNKIFIYDINTNKFMENIQLLHIKQNYANLIELKDGSVLISGGQYDDPNDNSSDLKYIQTTQIYK